MDETSGAGFLIRDPDSRLIVAGGVRLVDTYVPWMELRVAWKGITFARMILWADELIMEGDSSMVVAWLQECPGCGTATHPLMHNIQSLLFGCLF